MDGSFGNLKLYRDPSAGETTPLPAPVTPNPGTTATALPDPFELAGRELIRPVGRRDNRGREPFSTAWFDELEQKRYQRHGSWLYGALEFGRHPGESVLLLNPGMGGDAIRYLQHGSEVTIAVRPTDYPDLIRQNLARHGLTPAMIPISGSEYPFAAGTFDVAVWNGLYEPATVAPPVDELYRVLKAGGKVIGLFPARYDAGFWQDVLLPLQWLYWRRPADPVTATKTTARELRRTFDRFSEHRILKRHLRRSELPHLWRMLPLLLLERLIGRVLVLKAFKPISSTRTSDTQQRNAIAA